MKLFIWLHDTVQVPTYKEFGHWVARKIDVDRHHWYSSSPKKYAPFRHLSNFEFNCLLGKEEKNEACAELIGSGLIISLYLHKIVAAWMRILSTFLSAMSLVLTQIMTKCSCGFQKCDRNSGHRFCLIVLLKILSTLCTYLTHGQELMNQWGVIVMSHPHSWVKVIVWCFVNGHSQDYRLHSLCLFWLVRTEIMVTFKVLVVEFSMESHR
jgi:hypothetical protein